MLKNHKNNLFWLLGFCLIYSSCKIPQLVQKTENKEVPQSFGPAADSTNVATLNWKTYFADENLNKLIEIALQRNQELNITLQEIEIARNEVKARKGEILPSVGIRAGAGLEKVGRYTSQGAGDASTTIDHNKEMPDPLPDYMAGFYANWELDIWHKLRNAKQAAYTRYLSTVEGKNFVVTNLVAEIANSYYELLALDKQLEMVHQNIRIQNQALTVIKLQKEAARVTELPVKKFEAEVLKSKSLEFDFKQQIVETENKINFLLGRFPQTIERNSSSFDNELPKMVQVGVPAQLLINRPDIKQAELNLMASKLDVKVARTQFLPTVGISAALGLQAFNPSYLTKLPESMLYNLAGDIAAPLINRNAIKANYSSANAKQTQAVYEYEKSILNGYLEVSNQLSAVDNLAKNYALKAKQVEALNQSIDIVGDLFKSSRADYLEVLLTQRDALETKLELIETKKMQFNTLVKIYQALGGGWN